HGTGQGVLADAERHQELLLQHLAGMDIGQGSHGPTPHSLAAVQRWRVWFQPPSTRLETKPPMQAWAKPALRASTGPRCTGRRDAIGRGVVVRAGMGADADTAASGLDSST